MIPINKAIEEMCKRGYDAYEQDGDSLIHFRLPVEKMTQKNYSKISKDLKEIGWNKSWGVTGKVIE